jgi:predicted N-acetyltransferase YhbS
MGDSKLVIEPAIRKDIPEILELQERNLPDNGGTLSVRLSREWFETAICDMPVIVARSDSRVVGYVASTPLAAQAEIPIVQSMLRVYPGSPSAYIYGPVCVAESHRGRGLARAMFEELRTRLPEREGFTFIRRDNTRSISAHIKMGMRKVAEFARADVAYVVVSYGG